MTQPANLARVADRTKRTQPPHPVVAVVVIDDNAESLNRLTEALARPEVAVVGASTPELGLELVRKHHPRLVVTNLVMPGMTGLEVLEEVVRFDPTIDVVLMTAYYTTETAVAAIRQGAADYLQKPVRIDLLRDRISALIDAAQHRNKARSGAAGEGDSLGFEGLVSNSNRMWDLFALIQRVAPHYRSILIHGPTGVGKDLIADALHRRSGAPGRFIALNCSAVVESLFESELFGHLRGSFTGADRDKMGLFELAHGGTLFLDEIGDMSPAMQAKLLRVLQNQEILPVGGHTYRKVNVRIVAATHRDLRAEIAAGRFREDLYYRLAMVELSAPALRDRPEDIPVLARHFMRRFSKEFSKRVDALTPRLLATLQRYAWPGNVRELEHVIGRACMLTDGTVLDVQHLPEHMVHTEGAQGAHEAAKGGSALAEQERHLVEEALRAAKGNQSEAARRLGIGRDALRYKMKRYELNV